MGKFWPFASPREKQFDTYMQDCAQFKHFSGAVLVARGEKVLFSQAYGMASYELEVLNTPETIYSGRSVPLAARGLQGTGTEQGVAPEDGGTTGYQ